jgi:hypothetical protein
LLVTPTGKYTIKINGQSSMPTPTCHEEKGFGQCSVSASYTGDFRYCSGTPAIPK